MHFVVLYCIITFQCTVQKHKISLLNLSLHSEFVLNKYLCLVKFLHYQLTCSARCAFLKMSKDSAVVLR